MKKQTLIFGTLVLGGIAAAITYSLDVFNANSESTYEQKELSVLQARKADEAQAWLKARYVDVNTGLPITSEKLAEVQKNFDKLPKEKSIVWEEQGPDNIGGRTRAIQVDRTNLNEIWTGGVSGGLFRSTNGGNSWTRVDSYIAANASPFISSLTMTKDGTLYVATGSNQEGWDGNGVWYTTDKGLTWNKVPGTTNCTEVESGNVSDFVWMATPSGLRKWKLGDRIFPIGVKGSKLISDVLTDAKVLNSNRTNQWLLCDESKIISCLGYCVDRRAIANSTTEIIRCVEIEHSLDNSIKSV
jgi:tRNA(Ile)-lysidine synthetase-like protein